MRKPRKHYAKLKIDTNYFEHIDSSEKAYWLGFICADGHITKNGAKLAFCVKDKELLPKFKLAIRSEHKIAKRMVYDRRTQKYYSGFTLQVTNREFVKYLIELGIDNNKTRGLKFPKISEHFYPDFIAGLFDGDGSISLHKERLRLNLISTKEVLNFILRYINKTLGCKPTILQNVCPEKNVYKMFLYKDAPLFLKFIYCRNDKLYLQRKLKRARYKNPPLKRTGPKIGSKYK